MTENNSGTAKITFLPDNVTVDVKVGTTILDAALDNNIELNHNCGGFCACASCHVIVQEGMENLSEMQDDEEDQLEEADGLTLNSRLGCQGKIFGDVTVEIP